jgi:hypothetical protein
VELGDERWTVEGQPGTGPVVTIGKILGGNLQYASFLFGPEKRSVFQ